MKLSREDLRQAVSEAERLRGRRRYACLGQDGSVSAGTPPPPASAICPRHLKDIYMRAERMVKFGMDEHEHALLVKALDTARRAEEAAVGEGETLGLG